MKAGRLDRHLMIQRRTIAYDEYNSPIEVWSVLATAPAQVIQQSGREFLAADQIQAQRRVVFRMRWREDVTVLDRVSYDGLIHNIQDVKELGRREGLELMTVASV